MLYIAMSGAKQTLLAQTANTHNLANATTTGFRADLASFRSMPVYGPGEPSRVYAMAERAAVDHSPGTNNATGRELDIAINGEGWIAVQAADGTEAYTRAGDLRIVEGGLLKTGAGLSVLGNGGPIAIPQAEKIEIGNDGTISIQGIGQAPNTLTVVDRVKLVKPDAAMLFKGADGLIRHKENTPAAPDASVTIVSGALETSNVNTVESMVNMIMLGRQFEAQMKVFETAKENDNIATQLLSLNR
jgi:flagellar basal-body rod protein FlgF